MLLRLRPHLTFANVVSVIALVVALGGSAYAAISLPKNSVGTAQLKNNAITKKKIKNGAVSGSKIKLSTIGTVPVAKTALNASALGSLPPSAFLSSDVVRRFGPIRTPLKSGSIHLLTVDGVTFDGRCSSDELGRVLLLAPGAKTPDLAIGLTSINSTDVVSYDTGFGPNFSPAVLREMQSGVQGTQGEWGSGVLVTPSNQQLFYTVYSAHNANDQLNTCVFGGYVVSG
jgi:hypothetical protein